MGHGTPDWWGSEPGETTFQVQDVGELAARLKSIDSHDRRGNVIFLSSFEDGLSEFTTGAVVSGSYVQISALHARNGVYACKLYAAVGAGSAARVLRYQPIPVLSNLGVEISFTLDANVGEVRLRMALYDGTNFTEYDVRYLPATDKWQYMNSAGTWTDLVTGVDLYPDDSLFHTIKLVIDSETRKYAWFIYDNTEVAMTGIAGRPTLDATGPWLFTSFTLSAGASPSTIFCDDMIITQNEV